VNLLRAVLDVQGHCLRAWVARRQEERALGLMECRNLAPDEGMLFVCDAPDIQSFWMKDTPLPLSAAFIDDSGVIMAVVDMQPYVLEGHSCPHPVRFVLEVRQGWFAERGIGVGARVSGPPFAVLPADEPAAAK
jgi:hypothetical protein